MTTSNAPFKFVDLFAGIGGMRLAFESAGGNCVFSSEWDAHAKKTYAANFGEVPHGDIAKVESEEIPNFDVLSAGFPCQPFSTIGKREGFSHPTQGTLFHEVVRVLEHHRECKAILLENVVGLVTHDRGRTLSVIEESLADLGFVYDYRILDAYDFGVPQRRQRIYIVGYRRGRNSKGGRQDLEWHLPRKRHVDIGPFIELGAKGYEISRHLQDVYLTKLDDGRPEIVHRGTRGPVKTLVASYFKIQRLTGTFVRGGETGLRLLTESECKAIMGFPEDFCIPVSRSQMYKQFGNSVAVPVVRSLAQWISGELI